MTAGEASLGDSSLGRLVDVCEAPESLTENMSSSRNAPGAVSWTCSRWIICERPSHLFCFWFWSASLVFATWHNHRQIKASTTCARIDCLESSRLMFANLLLQLGIGEVLHMFAWRNSYQRGLRWFIGAKKKDGRVKAHETGWHIVSFFFLSWAERTGCWILEILNVTQMPKGSVTVSSKKGINCTSDLKLLMKFAGHLEKNWFKKPLFVKQLPP